MKQIFEPVIGIYKGIGSMLSETGKQSIKRGISALFAIAVAYMVWYFLNKRVPVEDQATLKYFFAGLLVAIFLLTGVATVKDILAFKNGQPAAPKDEDVKPEGGGNAAPLILLLLMSIIFSGCATERGFVKYHDKNDSTAAGHCAVWYPVKEKVTERIVEGKSDTQYVEGNIVYADCDSAYRAALDEAAKYGGNVIVQKVAVPGPRGIVVHDTVKDTKTVVVENTARVTQLQDQLGARSAERDKYNTAYVKWKKRAVKEGVGLAVILLGGVAYGYYKMKMSYLKKAEKIV
jgi:hypothetical protein